MTAASTATASRPTSLILRIGELYGFVTSTTGTDPFTTCDDAVPHVGPSSLWPDPSRVAGSNWPCSTSCLAVAGALSVPQICQLTLSMKSICAEMSCPAVESDHGCRESGRPCDRPLDAGHEVASCRLDPSTSQRPVKSKTAVARSHAGAWAAGLRLMLDVGSSGDALQGQESASWIWLPRNLLPLGPDGAGIGRCDGDVACVCDEVLAVQRAGSPGSGDACRLVGEDTADGRCCDGGGCCHRVAENRQASCHGAVGIPDVGVGVGDSGRPWALPG